MTAPVPSSGLSAERLQERLAAIRTEERDIAEKLAALDRQQAAELGPVEMAVRRLERVNHPDMIAVCAEVRRLQQQAEAHAQAAQSWGDAEAAYKLALRTERERYNALLDQLASAREETAQANRMLDDAAGMFERMASADTLAADRHRYYAREAGKAIRSRSLSGETADA